MIKWSVHLHRCHFKKWVGAGVTAAGVAVGLAVDVAVAADLVFVFVVIAVDYADVPAVFHVVAQYVSNNMWTDAESCYLMCNLYVLLFLF